MLLIIGVVGLVLDRQHVVAAHHAARRPDGADRGRDLITSILAATSPQWGGRDRHWSGHAVHWRHGGLRRTPGDDEPDLGSPARADPRGLGGDLGLAPGADVLARPGLCPRLPAPRVACHQRRAGECRSPVSRPGASAPEPCLELAVSLLVLTFVFALFFKYVPDAEISWRDVWLGGLLTAALFTLGKTAIGVYLGRASVGSAYGAAGSMVVLLVWVYYSALILFFGAEFTQAWATRHGGVTPQPHALSGPRPRPKARRPPTAPAGVDSTLGARWETHLGTHRPAAPARTCACPPVIRRAATAIKPTKRQTDRHPHRAGR